MNDFDERLYALAKARGWTIPGPDNPFTPEVWNEHWRAMATVIRAGRSRRISTANYALLSRIRGGDDG